MALIGPPAQAQEYRGPVKSSGGGGESTELCVVQMTKTYENIAGSSIGLQINVNTGQVTSCPDWASASGVYEEYRILAMCVEWKPHFGRSTGAVTQAAGVGNTTHTSVIPAPYTSMDQLTQYDGWTYFNTASPWRGEWHMRGSEEAQFLGTGATVVHGTINAVAFKATSTSGYGNLHITYRVQFRGRA